MILLIPTWCFGFTAKSLYEKDASELIYTEDVTITGVMVNTDGTNDATLYIYDSNTDVENSSVVHKVFTFCEIKVTGSDYWGGRNFNPPDGIRLNHGMHTILVGTGATYTIEVR